MNWSPTEAFKSLVSERSRGLFSTVVVEEAINVAKNNRKRFVGKRYRKPEAIKRSILASELQTVRHHYEPAEVDSIRAKKSDVLSRDAFQAQRVERTLKFEELVSSSSSTSWWSPTAQGLSAPAADLQVIRDIAPKFHLFSQCFLAKLFHFKHGFVFRRVPPVGGASDVWWMPMESCDDSALIVWPFKRIELPSGQSYFDPVLDIGGPQLVTIITLDGFEAVPIVWRSPVYQAVTLGAFFGGKKISIRPFADGPATTVLKVAAAKGFWELKKSFVEELGSHIGAPRCSTFFDLLMHLVTSILGVAEDDALDCLAHRLAARDRDMAHAAALAEIDEGIQVLDQRDHMEVKGSVKEMASNTVERAQFSAAVQARRAAVRAAAAKGGRRKKRNDSSAPSAPRPFPNTISQPEAKLFIPEGSSIWKSNTRFAWCGHVPPRARISEQWQKHGSDQVALQCLLARMWRQHCELNAIPEADCPWILGSAASAEGAAATSSAASRSAPLAP